MHRAGGVNRIRRVMPAMILLLDLKNLEELYYLYSFNVLHPIQLRPIMPLNRKQSIVVYKMEISREY